MADADRSPADLTGRTLGDFQILRRIGGGGMGQVYLARQLSLKRDVAVKLLRNELTANPTALKRFEAEAHAVARLNHPNIVQVYHLGEHDGLRYMALEFVDGRNLRDYLDRKGPPDLPVSLSVMRQVAMALQKAHEQGIVHRDIKPENILVTRKVEVKVTDFGLSRFFAGAEPAMNLTQSGVTVGTPLYLSPEQAQGHAVDHRSDLYSFGVTCYHLLAGEPPFRGATAVEVALKHINEAPRSLSDARPDLPADLCDMVHKLLAKKPGDRYPSARDVLRDLARVREGVGLGLTQAGLLMTAAGPTAGAPTILGLSGSATSAATVPSGPTMVLPVVRRPVRWGRWAALVVTCGGGAAGGAVLYAQMNPPADTTAVPPTAGLPDIRPPGKPTTARERALLGVLDSRESSPQEVVLAAVELGLGYVRERRLDEADARFKKLEGERFSGDVLAGGKAHTAGRLGQAIVLAHRDQAAASVKLFATALAPGKDDGRPVPKGRMQEAVRKFLLAQPGLSQAMAEALDRDAENLGGKPLVPEYLERLRKDLAVAKPGRE